MATEVISTIGASGDYASLSDWQAANNTLAWASVDQIPVAELLEDLTEFFSFSGWTDLDADHPCTIRAAPGLEGQVTVSIWDSYNGALEIKNDFLTLEDFILKNRSTSTGRVVQWARGVVTSHITCRRMKFICSGTNDFYAGHLRPSSSGGSQCYAVSCEFTGGGYVTDARADLENCTAHNMIGTAFKSSWDTKPNWKNIVAVNCSPAFESNLPAGSPISNCASDDASAATLPGTGHITGVSTADGVDFVSPYTGDYHLTASSILKGAGVNLYDGTGTQTDIDGDPWPATGAWDIGADYFVSASGDVTVSLTGQDGAGAVGVVTASATTNAAAALSTVAGFGGIGNILAEAGGSTVATLSAVSASAAVGVIAAYVSNPASVSLAGVESQSAVGSLIASGGLNASVLLSGNAAAAALGGLAATGTASAVAVLAGVQLSGVSGNVVALSPDAAVSFGSVAAFAGIGSIAGVAINPDATVTIGTVSGNGRVGQLAADAAGLHGWVLEGGISASWGIESAMNSVWTEET